MMLSDLTEVRESLRRALDATRNLNFDYGAAVQRFLAKRMQEPRTSLEINEHAARIAENEARFQ